LEYPELIVGDDATAALQRLTAMNAAYEHLAACGVNGVCGNYNVRMVVPWRGGDGGGGARRVP
jgi:hypothetical protein